MRLKQSAFLAGTKVFYIVEDGLRSPFLCYGRVVLNKGDLR